MKTLKTMAFIAATMAATVASATQYSCLSIIVASKQLGKWPALKAWIAAADLEDEWAKCSYLSDDYPAFITATNSIIQSGIATSAEVNQILAASVDTALPDKLMNAKYERDMKTDSGRRQWHGNMKTYIDTNNLVRVYMYDDGYTYTEPWKRPESVMERKIREATALVNAAKRSARGKPKAVQDIIIKRAEREALVITNGAVNVTVDVKTGNVVNGGNGNDK